MTNKMDTVPRDGTMVRLLVEFTANCVEDSTEPCWTIGANTFDNDGIDEWKFAGWDWCSDQFTQGAGTPIGWLPIIPTDEALSAQFRDAYMDWSNKTEWIRSKLAPRFLGMHLADAMKAEFERLEHLAEAGRECSRRYEELRKLTDGGHESMTHEDALHTIKVTSDYWDLSPKRLDQSDSAISADTYARGWNDALKLFEDHRKACIKAAALTQGSSK